MQKTDAGHGIEYFNCGAWIDAHPTFITVGDDGVRIHEYVERPDDLHPAGEQAASDIEAGEFGNEPEWLEDGEFEGVAT